MAGEHKFRYECCAKIDRLWVVARFGPYMHYAVPRIFHQAGVLERLYTDLYADWWWCKILQTVPKACRSPVFERILGRKSEDLPPYRVKSYPAFAI